MPRGRSARSGAKHESACFTPGTQQGGCAPLQGGARHERPGDGTARDARPRLPAEVGIATFSGDTWAEGWYLADGVGILLQLAALQLLAGLGCKPLA